ncbi:sensor histidine kinase [Frateuria defendens]|uniref:sensor histidine kinase n=1 Tax=Frateuria defendens TaxID=2219559 RepID=UPI00066FC1AE|nr:sensor histidine kinase [Frateuria defendens]
MASRAAGGRSIRRQLLASLGALFLLGMLALFVAARSYGRRAADMAYDHLLAASALSIADHVALVRGQWRVDLPYAALELLAMAPEDRVFYLVSAPDGSVLTGYDDLPAPPHELGRLGFYDATYSGERVRVVQLERWSAGSATHGGAHVQVAQTRRARDALAGGIVWRATLAIAVLTLAALLLAWLAVNRALQPIARLERDLGTRSPADLRPVACDVPQELHQLVGALNRFMARLGENLDTLRAFIGEAAHQLRTPLAALRAQAQLAVDEDDPTEQHRSLLAIERNADALGRLTNQLLSDASVSHRGHLQRFGPLDLAEIVREALHATVPLREPRPRLELAGLDGPAPMVGDALMLREAIKNLIDNALKYGAPERGPLHVALAPHADGWRLSVRDHGPGIAAEEAELVFERFRRGSAADGGGAGLGLAIVRRVAHSHGGRVALSNLPDGGLRVDLELPGAPR